MDKELQQQLEAGIKEASFTDATYTKILDEETGQEVKVFVVSDETVDREGEVISIDGWKLDNFKRNPVMLWSHNPFDPPIGKWQNIKFRTINGKKKLTMEPDFHRKSDLSNLLAELVENGYPPQTTSVGFRAMERNGNTFTKQELLEVSFVNIPANPEATDLALTRGYSEEVVSKVFYSKEVDKTVISFKDTPQAIKGESWDGAAEVASATPEDLKAMCAWYDSEKPDLKSSYKLPHHHAAGDHAVVWRGVVSAMAALLGARGGIRIPDEDRKGIYNHLVKHYAQFSEEPPEFRDYDEAELKSLFPEAYPLTQQDVKYFEDKIAALEVAVRSAKPTATRASRPGSGRSDESKQKRLIQLANKALDNYLRLEKAKNG